MKIGEIGRKFRSTDNIDFFSTATLLEYDALLVDFVVIATESHNSHNAIFSRRHEDL